MTFSNRPSWPAQTRGSAFPCNAAAYSSCRDHLRLLDAELGFQVFDVIYALTGGGPGRATQSVAMNIYEEAFRGNIRYGYATAKSTILFVIVLIITLIQLRVMKSREAEL